MIVDLNSQSLVVHVLELWTGFETTHVGQKPPILKGWNKSHRLHSIQKK